MGIAETFAERGVTVIEPEPVPQKSRAAANRTGVVSELISPLQPHLRKNAPFGADHAEIIRALDPSFILTATVVESSIPLLRDQLSPEALGQMIQTQVSRSIREVTYRIPSLVEATTKWLDQYEQGRLSFHLDTSDLSPQVAELNRGLTKSSDRLVMGLVMAGWLVGAAIASTVDVQVGGFQLSDLAFYMFMAGAIVGAVIVFQAGRRLNQAEADE